MIREEDQDGIAAAIRLVEDAWEELRRGAFVQQNLGVIPSRLPDLSLDEAERRSSVGKTLLDRANRIDLEALPHDLALTVRLVRFRARIWAKEAEWYWTVSDPMGVGFFGLFHPTAYCGGFLLNVLRTALASFRFSEPGDLDRYLALAADYSRLLDQMTARTLGQAERGIYLPKVQVAQARALMSALEAQCGSLWTVAPARLASLRATGFAAELEGRIASEMRPAFGRLIAVFSDQYLARAPEAVGIGQYPNGGEIYAELVRLHTTMDLTPEAVHRMGHERMERIQSEMRSIREAGGFSGDQKAYLDRLSLDSRWRADTADGVAAVFRRYIERMKPVFGRAFDAAPNAGHDVAPLPDALQASMTFGYYDAPKPDRPLGLYLFNAANLTQTSLFNLGALTYHELVPGHHLHLASQQENQRLHPFRSSSFVNAYNEGWAEYAATLAGELGLYPEPEERYGRLAMDAFLTCRLVVDTGMNALGWPLERARDYLRAHSTMAETEIRSETIRYSCDIPAQSLAYKLGDAKSLEYRARMQRSLGDRFDLKAFHRAVLSPGALPLPDLEWNLARQTQRLCRSPN